MLKETYEMKKIRALILVITLAMIMCACGNESSMVEDEVGEEISQIENPDVEDDEIIEETNADVGIQEDTPTEEIVKSEEEIYQEYCEKYVYEGDVQERKKSLNRLRDIYREYGASGGNTAGVAYYDDCRDGSEVIAELRTNECEYIFFGNGTALVRAVKDLNTLPPEIEYEGKIYQVKFLGGVNGGTEEDTLVIPSFITRIRNGGLSGCTAKEIIIPDTVEDLNPTRTFAGCKKLEKVTFPKNFSTNGRWFQTFYGCSNLKEVSLPKGASILGYTFEDCVSLTNVVLSEDTSVLQGTFENCTSLKQITLPDNIIYMGRAFTGCSVESIELPKYLGYLGELALSGTILGQKEVIELPRTLVVMDLTAYTDTNVTEIIIPDTVKEITGASVQNCPLLTKVVMPDELFLANSFSVSDTPKLETVVYPDTVTAEDIRKGDFSSAELEGTLTLYVPKELVGQIEYLGKNIIVMPKE